MKFITASASQRSRALSTVHRSPFDYAQGGLFTLATLLLMGVWALPAHAQMKATGGTITRYRENTTNFIAHIFTNSGTLTFASSTKIEYLLVAGGGGGGGAHQGGGGGAGGFLTGVTSVMAQAYTVTVGANGIGGYTSENASNGGDSSLTNASLAIVAYGGGAGGGEGYSGKNGGSGGGQANGPSAGTGLAGPPRQGYDGGSSAYQSGAGGGGAAGPGQICPGPSVGGGGGPGRSSTMRNGVTAVTYATGGAGSNGRTAPSGPHRNPNTGDGGYGGGGVGNSSGNNGGSGIVVVRYVDTGNFSATVTATSPTAQWPLQIGAFTITRPNDANINYSATVSYTMSGTAVNGVDYSENSVANSSTGFPTPTPMPLSGAATFGVGVRSVVVNVYPLCNSPFSAKTATMTLNVVGSPAATVNFTAWSAAHFANVTSGGVLTNYMENGTNYAARIFTNSAAPDKLTVSAGGTIEYLLVAGGGGGGGGWNGGGGGAGGVRLGSVPLPAGTYTVRVGAGGPGANRLGAGINGSNGLPSVISAAVDVIGATGGGRGFSEAPTYVADNGGSGGGPGGLAVGGDLGNNGYGTGYGGGGGASTVGGPSEGGAGTNLIFSGVSVEYAKGGYGTTGRVGRDGTNALANTGNGGGGGDGGPTWKGGNGGSGIVIVRSLDLSILTIYNDAVTSLATNSATFNGYLISPGSSACAVCVLWGESNGGATWNWANTNWLTPPRGGWSNNSPLSINIRLNPNKTIYYTYAATNKTTSAVAASPKNFITGTVEVRVTKRESTEEKPAEFVITRPATTVSVPLEVFFTLGGIGVNGTDYEQLDSPAIIPAGKAEIRLRVNPKFNFGDQRPKSVELTLAPGGYVVGANKSARILTRAE